MFIARRRPSRAKTHKKAIFAGLGLLLILAVAVGIPAFFLYRDYQFVTTKTADLQEAWEQKNLSLVQEDITQLREYMPTLQRHYRLLGFSRYILGLGYYYTEGEKMLELAQTSLEIGDKVVVGIQPYQTFLGLRPDAPDTSVQTKIEQLVQILPQLLPVFDEMDGPLHEAIAQIKTLDPSGYPEELQGIALKDSVIAAQSFATALEPAVADLKPLLMNLTTALGEPEPQTYLVLFMNDKERRPIMGFITAYTLVTFRSGTFEIADSYDIYEVSDEESFLPLPSPLAVYLKAGGFHLRDVNYSPDYAKSMDDFNYYWQRLGQPSVDGIVAIDTHFLQGLLGITGPISLPAYEINYAQYPGIPESCSMGGTEFTHENVVCRLELFSQRLIISQSQRKAILGDLMKEIIDRILQAPQDQWGHLFETVFTELHEKHLLVNLRNEDLQALAETYNIGGKVLQHGDTVWMDEVSCQGCAPMFTPVTFGQADDYLHINDANLAGLKSDFFIKRTVTQSLRQEDDGRLVSRVELTYHNTGINDGWLNAVGRNYVRVYVPLGSELLHAEGGEAVGGVTSSEDLNKTVFDNFLLIPPLESKTIVFEYRLPATITPNNYRLIVQKQPGLDRAEYAISLKNKTISSELLTDVVYDIWR